MPKTRRRSSLSVPSYPSSFSDPSVQQAPAGSFGVSGLTLLGVGGIIGAGFFLASGISIHKAGPAVIISYLLGAIIMSQVMGAIVSVAVNRPAKGAFLVHTEEMLGPYIGFLQGWISYFSGILAVASEAVAMSIFTKYWLPGIPLSAMSTAYIILILLTNAFGIQNFSKIESLMSVVKILALVGFILVALLTLIGWVGVHHPVGVTLLTGGGGFMPNGLRGVWQSMLIVIFSYAGIGVIANSTSDARNPRSVIPKATTGVISLTSLLYIASTALLVLVFPWQQIGTNQSPFVAALNSIHIPFASSVLNAVILISAFSVMAGTLFSVLTILRSLAEKHIAPQLVLKETSRGLPIGALSITTGCLFLVLVLAYLLPSKIYNYLISASAYFTFFGWAVMLLTFLVWLRHEKQPRHFLSRWAFAAPFGQWIILLAIIALAAYSVVDPDQRVGFYYALAVFVAITIGYLGYRVFHRKNS